jgi:hypothetical protein
VHPLAPGLELRVLRLEHRRLGLLVHPVLEADLVVVGEDPVRLQALVPREGEPLLGALEIVLDVALPADVRAHLLARGHLVHLVVRSAGRRLDLGDPLHERRAGDPQRHGLRVVAVDAGDRMRHFLARVEVAHVVVRGVAVVAHRHRVVAGAGPALELLAHDVAVHARLRVVGQVRAAAGVGESEAAHADQHAEGDPDGDAQQRDGALRSAGHGVQCYLPQDRFRREQAGPRSVAARSAMIEPAWRDALPFTGGLGAVRYPPVPAETR